MMMSPSRHWTIVDGPSVINERHPRTPVTFTVLDSHSIQSTVDVRLESVSDKKDDLESRIFRGRLRLKTRVIKVIGLYSPLRRTGSMEEA